VGTALCSSAARLWRLAVRAVVTPRTSPVGRPTASCPTHTDPCRSLRGLCPLHRVRAAGQQPAAVSRAGRRDIAADRQRHGRADARLGPQLARALTCILPLSLVTIAACCSAVCTCMRWCHSLISPYAPPLPPEAIAITNPNNPGTPELVALQVRHCWRSLLLGQ
jgi:hypothetical protein